MAGLQLGEVATPRDADARSVAHRGSPFLPPDVRARFPGIAGTVYLNCAETGIIPRTTADAAHAYVEAALAGGGDKAGHKAAVEYCRKGFAGLIGAEADEVAITKNVSEGLNLFASSLPWKAGDNVVLCPEVEHPNNVFLWYNLRALKGIEVRTVEPDEGRIPVEGIAAAVDERTALVTVPHVSFSPGFVTDVRGVADAAHRHGGLLLVDAAQSLGAIRCDVRELGIDALAVATQKNLLGLYGLGFLYVRRALADSLIPGHVARYGMDLGTDAGETARSGGETLPYAPGARRFDLGNYNYLGIRAFEASLQLLSSVGVDRIERHLKALATRLVEGLIALGLPVAGGAPGPHLGHIVAMGRSGGGHHDTADDPEMNELYRHLVEHGVHLSVRKGVLRMSLGLYNDVSDVDRTLELIREWMETRKDGGDEERRRSRVMNRILVAALMTASLAAPARAQQEHARFDFPAVVNGQQHILTYEGTHDVTRPDPAVKLVVFVHHGGSQNPVTYFNSMKAALDVAALDRPGLHLAGSTMIIAPGMIGDLHVADNPVRYAKGHYPQWDDSWREGAPSVNEPRVSNYDLLDAMVLHVADRFPGVKAIVHVGHSAGGQLVSRYSFGTPVYDTLRRRGIFVRYIISNPSSVLYFDRQRPDLITGKGFIDYTARWPVLTEGECRGFNTYKYGLDGMAPYMTRRPVSAMLASFRRREVFLLQGLEDTDPNDDGLDRDCPGMLQGRVRLERGQRYYEYLGQYFGPEIYETKFLVLAPGLGHDSGAMFRSESGKPLIFIDADSAAAAIQQQDAARQPANFTLVIHGGGGVRTPAEFAARPGLEQAYRDTLAVALKAGYEVLSAGGSAVEAVEAAIRVMEDSPLFNAGKGASYTTDGTVELDASMMDGRTMKAGGIAAARYIRNPISLARIVLEKTPHVLVAGEGGIIKLAQEVGVPLVPESYFYTEDKWNELQERMRLEVPFGTPMPPPSRPPEEDPDDTKLWGTVGAVALDSQGNLAAGTSTGGRITKRPGRVGDSPIIGASTYANNDIVAVSTTGLGEKHMVLLTAKEIASLIAYRGMSVQEAADNALKVQLVGLGGSGGAIALDKNGNIATPYTDAGMYRGWVRADGVIEVRIYDR